jgi:NADPH2:quinone reductase
MGARVIGLASTADKRELVERLGADASVDSRTEEVGEALLEANGGEQVDVVLQMSGGEAFDRQLDVLAPFGRMITFGIASREPHLVKTQKLMRTSRSVVGFWIVHLLRRPDLLKRGISELLGAVASGELEVVIGAIFPMSDVAQAQIELQERRTHGKLLLDPSA